MTDDVECANKGMKADKWNAESEEMRMMSEQSIMFTVKERGSMLNGKKKDDTID